jgi:pyruvate,orthophosphate dikinase
MWMQELEALKDVEKKTGKKFGDPSNPLLVSCRSGSKFSMPGMMDTVLNIGLNDEVAKGMVKLFGDERFVYDAYRRLVEMFGSTVFGIPDEPFEHTLGGYKQKKGYKLDTEMNAEDWKSVTEAFKGIISQEIGRDFPQDPLEQLSLATEAVFKSWNGKRAVDYRNASGIAHDLGTAVNIVTMVFGNMGSNSGTGVAFTRDPSTGEQKMYGDYLMNAQGEDVVAGIRNTEKIENLVNELPEAYRQFMEITDRLERHYKEMQDVEFTIERGKLWMLQTRNGKRTAKAAVKIAVDMANEKLISKEDRARAEYGRPVAPAVRSGAGAAERAGCIQRCERPAAVSRYFGAHTGAWPRARMSSWCAPSCQMMSTECCLRKLLLTSEGGATPCGSGRASSVPAWRRTTIRIDLEA